MSVKYKIEVLDSSGQSVIASSGKYGTITTKEEAGKLPTFKVEIIPGVFIDTEAKDYTFKITTDYFSYSSPACITDIKHTNSIVTLSGIFCTFEQLFLAKTRFLGSGTKSAYSALKFHQKMSVENNYMADHFQVNMTDAEYLKLLCKIESVTPYWCIGIDEINLKSPTSKYNFIAFEKSSPVVFHPQEKNEFEVIQENYNNTYFSSTSGWNTMLALETNKDAIPNFITNEFSRTSILPIATVSGVNETIYPLKLGEYMYNVFGDYKQIDCWRVSSIERIFQPNKVVSKVSLQGVI